MAKKRKIDAEYTYFFIKKTKNAFLLKKRFNFFCFSVIIYERYIIYL